MLAGVGDNDDISDVDGIISSTAPLGLGIVAKPIARIITSTITIINTILSIRM